MIPLGVLASARVEAAGGWTPASLPTLHAWWDPSDAATITQSGGLVSQMADKSGSGLHMVASAGAMPTWGASTQNGLYTLDYTIDASDAMYTSGVGGLTQPFTVATVVKLTITSGSTYIFTTPSAPFFYCYAGELRLYQTATGPARAADTSWHIHTATFDGTTSKLRIDGGSEVSGGIGGTGIGTSFILGAISATGNSDISGYIAETVVCSGVLAGSDLTSLEAYLQAKWSIA